MRRVDAEGDSRGVRVQKQAGARLKSRLRRAAIESLERRELLSTSTSTLPSPTVLSSPSVVPNFQVQDVSLATAPQALTAAPSASSPSVSVDPNNPLKIVATWVDHDPVGYPGGNFTAPVTSYIEGAYSLNGGATWNPITSQAFGTGGFGRNSSVNVQQDFSVVPPTGSVTVFTETTDASIGFDRSENFYILSSTHNVANSAGVLDIQRFSFSGNTPTYNGIVPVYSWDQADSAANGGTVDQAVMPTLAVDTNVPTFTDPTSGNVHTDPYSGNLYVAWAEVDSPVYNNVIPNFNPNTIKMTASSDTGLHFTHAAYVDDSSNANGHNTGVVTNPPPPQYPLHDSSARYAAPQITVSAGNTSGTVPAGQVTVVYDDYGTVAPLDQILVQTDLIGGTSEQFSYANAQQTPNINTSIPITVNITDPNFVSLQSLDVTTTVAWPNISEIAGVLIPSPAAVAYLMKVTGNDYSQGIVLFDGDVGINNSSGTPSSAANLGDTSGSGSTSTNVRFTAGSGTVFDPESVRNIENGNVGSTAVGHFQPDGEAAFLALKGAKASDLNGSWSYEVVQLKADTSTAPMFVNGLTLNFTSGMNPGAAAGAAGAEVTVAGKFTAVSVNVPGINPTNPASSNGTVTNAFGLNQVTPTGVSGSGNTTAPAQGAIPILPAPVIASDNTLGSFSQHAGRLYVAFTGMFSNAQAGNSDIFMLFSDDGGKTWQGAKQVNDDNAATDGYSGSVAGGTLGRTQYQPQIAVDQSTGTLVVSFLDARNDASNARVATYVAASNDGGVTFAADVFANPTSVATDAITGNTVNLGPVPDNQSVASGEEDTNGYGSHQALIVTNGRIIPFWTSNQNLKVPLGIVDSIMSDVAGPRIIASTQGPVGLTGDTLNTTKSADGTTKANTIEVTFDRPIDPATFKTSNVSVYYKKPSGGAPILLPVTSVTALDPNTIGSVNFKITFDPTGLASFVGTYSYVINPTGISDRIRHVVSGGTVANGNVMDQNADGTTGQLTGDKANSSVFSLLAGDNYLVGQPNPTVFTVYAPGTLPLIVPGPHVNTIAAVDATGNVISSGVNNLVLNNTVNALQVTFDRNIQVSSFNVAQILSIFGPAGVVTLAGLVITPLSVFTTGGQMPYAVGGQNADVFKVSFATQQLSGTYTMTLGAGILASDGSGVDASLDAGLDVLRGIATNGATTPVTYPASSSTVPATIQPETVNSDGSTTPSILMAPITVPDDYPIQGDNGTISGITLSLDISYANDPDLVAYLLAPDGVTKINLFSNVGGGTNTANFSSTTLSDTASTSIDKAGAPFFGTFLPEAPFSNLSNAGLNSVGTWNLVIKNSGSSSGSLNSWSLTFQKPVSSTNLGQDPVDRTSVNFQIFNLAATNALANSTWTAVGPAGITTVGATTPVTFPTASTVVPAVIQAGSVASPSFLMSPINVTDNFPIQADTASLSGLTVSLNITYANDPNLIAYLLAPDGVTKIPLFSNVGAANGANFTGTTLSDVGGKPFSAGVAPFNGTFTPQSPLSGLSAAGLSSVGTWTLVIENTGALTGKLNNWALTFQKPSATFAGAVSTVAVDPSDKTGNTVFVGSASGGIWKTSDFLTNKPGGPTYVPLTDFGPNYSLNIGSIGVFGRNNDPNQSVIFAGTGFAQERTISTSGSPNVDLNSGRGVGIIRSTDGGLTWTLLDSLVNTDSSGNPLPEASRDHAFIGNSTYKIVVDPTPGINGQIIVYAATSSGLFQSLDSGNTWHILQAGNATDVLLDPNSKSPTTGNLDILYAAFSAVSSPSFASPVGIYVSSNQGQTLLPVTGQLGKNPLIVSTGFPAQPTTVANAGVTPNNLNSAYIVLAKPALTGNIAVNLNYQDWLYAAVENYNGTFQGLYVTKDRGENWTLVQLPNIPGNNSVKAAVPTNDTTGANSYDPTSSNFTKQGAYDLTITVDPTNPNIVYIGGSHDFQGSGLIRVDLTDLHDAHNFTSFSSNRTDGGLLTINAQGGVTVSNTMLGAATYDPNGSPPEAQLLNLRHAPNNGTAGTSPFNINATLVVFNTTTFLNDGTGATWSQFDEPLKANAGDATGSTNVHDEISYVDPITGDVRLLFADDMGVFTALVNPDGTLNNGIGSDIEVNYSRNGNIQNEQFLDSAAQPSKVASQAAGALFYASGQNTIAAQSDANVLTDGNLTWDNSSVLSPASTSPRSTSANSAISSSDRSGVGIATDPTGSTTSLYEFDVPLLGGNLTDFFRVNQFGQTTGLADKVNQEFPAAGYNGDAHQGGVIITPVTNVAPGINGAIVNGQIPVGNFTVNPLNGNQILIASATGNLYETTNQGIQFLPIGNAADFGADAAIIDAVNGGFYTGKPGRVNPLPIQVSAIAYGAPDPNVTGGVGNLNNFIYVGTTGTSYSTPDPGQTPPDNYIDGQGLLYNDAHIYVTQAGGQGWTDISRGLDGSSVVGIYPAPDRGSHAAYAVTLTGIFYSPDTTGLEAAGKTVWTNITSNLPTLQYNPYGNSTYQQSVLADFNYIPPNLVIPPPMGTPNLAPPQVYNPQFNAQYGGFTGIVADYRYQIPDAANVLGGAQSFHPVLYVSGYGGVFRSIDNGATWTVFPNTSFDAAPVDGGYLPSVDVTNLQLVLGDINPSTGHATQATGDPEVLLASTFGRGDFAIRLAPDVLPTSIQFDATLPIPGGSDSGTSSTDLITNVTNPYIDGISEVSNYGNVVTITLFDESPGSPYFGTKLGTATTNQLGVFSAQIGAASDPWFNSISSANQGDKIVGIQATDSSGASGNLTLFKYTLDLVTPATPAAPVLEALYDTGRSSSDGLTDVSVPAQTVPGAALTFTSAPIFDVTSQPTVNPLIPTPVSLTVELLRAISPNGPFSLVDMQPGGSNAAASTVMLTDASLLALLQAGPVDQTFYYEALQVDNAGNVSTPASNLLTITVDTIAPVAPTGLALASLSTTTPPHPIFNAVGVLPGDQLFLFRSVSGLPAVQVGIGPINTTGSSGTFQVTDMTGAFPDGVYTYYAVQQDIYGNLSPLSTGLNVTINTQTPPMTPILVTDTGRSITDKITNIEVPPPPPGASPSYVAPGFNVNAIPPLANQPAIASVQLLRSASPTGPFVIVGTAAYSSNPALVTDTNIPTLAAAGPIDQYFYYEAEQTNAAGIVSNPSTPLKVFIDTIVPTTLATPTLDPASNTGLVKTQNITNITHPIIDATGLLPANPLLNNALLGNQLLLYRSKGGAAAILVGTGTINMTNGTISATVTDTTGATPDGVYVYQVVQVDVAGNISNFSMPLAVTINTTTPVAPTINLLTSDDTGLPSHPNVTKINTPHFNGTAQFNAGTNFPLNIINVATGAVLASTFPSANGTYLAQITTPLADGVYTLEARTTNLAGTFSFSAPLTITIKHTGPQITPTLIILPADDTGLKGDGVTANHDPRFTGTTDKGVTVSLYAVVNGQLLGPEATTTSSTINGTFTFKLPNNLTDGSTQLFAQATDIANNNGAFSPPLVIQIVTTAGDYLGVGAAQLTVFDPLSETYFVRGLGAATVDSTPGRDVPIQYDFNGDGLTDLSAYRYDTATYFGFVSNTAMLNQQFGAAGAGVPVSGYYGGSGTFIYGTYQSSIGVWSIELPQANGLVVHFGVAGLDIPTPAAFNGSNSTELAVFRPSTIIGNDADSFTVIGTAGSVYMVSFTSPAVAKLGFVYKAGDIPAPADYDGVGHDEFAVYRPSTGQFFILNTPNPLNSATWTLRTVTLNLPGGPNVNDVPASQDYDGNGKIDPTVFRPSNSTFYMIHSSTGIQENIQFGTPNRFMAAAGPLLYRLTALKGVYASTGGFGVTPGGGGTSGGTGSLGILHALSITSASSGSVSSAPASSPLSTMIALAAPLTVSTPAAPSAPSTVAAPAAKYAVTVGASTPSAFIPLLSTSTSESNGKGHQTKAAKAKKPAAQLVVDTKSHETLAKTHAVESAAKLTHAKAPTAAVKPQSTTSKALHKLAAALPALQGLVMARKGKAKS